MEGGKSALGSTAVWGGLVAILAGLAPLVGYTVSADDQAALVNLIQSGMVTVTAAASLVGGIMAVYGRIRATRQITGLTPAAATANASRTTGLGLALAFLAVGSLTACHGLPAAVGAAVGAAGATAGATAGTAAVVDTGSDTACSVLRWGVPIAVARLPAYGPQEQAIVADAEAVIAAGCRADDATWQQRAAAAAGALVKVLWGLVTG